jgi:hypothetical protein
LSRWKRTACVRPARSRAMHAVVRPPPGVARSARQAAPFSDTCHKPPTSELPKMIRPSAVHTAPSG